MIDHFCCFGRFNATVKIRHNGVHQNSGRIGLGLEKREGGAKGLRDRLLLLFWKILSGHTNSSVLT